MNRTSWLKNLSLSLIVMSLIGILYPANLQAQIVISPSSSGGGSFSSICGDSADTEILFNNAGACDGSSSLTWNGSTVKLPSITAPASILTFYSQQNTGALDVTLIGYVNNTTDFGYAEHGFGIQNPNASPELATLYFTGADGNYSDAGAVTNQRWYVYNNQTSTYDIVLDVDGELTIDAYSGTGVQYACFDAAGKLTRSATACGS